MNMSPSVLGNSFVNVDAIADALGDIQGMKVVDFGCGTGHFTVLFAQRAGQSGTMTAVDILKEPLEHVQARAEASGLGNVRTVRADLEVARSTGLDDNSQDVVFIANVLYQATAKNEVIREAYRILKTGGRLLVLEWKQGVKGFGPPEESRLGDADIEELISGVGFALVSKPESGTQHIAFLFRK